jgi:hypothetical protein
MSATWSDLGLWKKIMARDKKRIHEAFDLADKNHTDP